MECYWVSKISISIVRYWEILNSWCHIAFQNLYKRLQCLLYLFNRFVVEINYLPEKLEKYIVNRLTKILKNMCRTSLFRFRRLRPPFLRIKPMWAVTKRFARMHCMCFVSHSFLFFRGKGSRNIRPEFRFFVEKFIKTAWIRLWTIRLIVVYIPMANEYAGLVFREFENGPAIM